MGLMSLGIMPHVPETPTGLETSTLLPSTSAQPWITGIVIHQSLNTLALTRPIQATILTGIPNGSHSLLSFDDLIKQSLARKLYGSCLSLSAISSTFSRLLILWLSPSPDAAPFAWSQLLLPARLCASRQPTGYAGASRR